jgi:hypothetical protein
MFVSCSALVLVLLDGNWCCGRGEQLDMTTITVTMLARMAASSDWAMGTDHAFDEFMAKHAGKQA